MLKEQEKIERYLNGEMQNPEKEVFEQEIKNNTDLSDKIAFHKDLLSFFNSRNVDLEETLSNLGNEYFSDEKPIKPVPDAIKNSSFTNNKRFIIPLLLLLIVIIGGFWYFNDSDEPVDITPSMSTSEAEKIINEGMIDEQGKEVINEIEENIPTEIKETKETEEDLKTDPPKFDIDEIKGATKQEDEPMAILDKSNFQENMALESLISENLRSDTNISVNTPAKGQRFEQKDGIVALSFNGTTSKNDKFELIIYDNKAENFNNDYSILSTMLKTTPDENTFNVSFNVMIELKKGLYYYIIRRKDEAQILHISKFFIQ